MRLLFLNARLSDRGGADRWLLGVLARLQGRAETLLAVGRRDPGLAREEEDRVGEWRISPGLDRRGLRDRGRSRAVRELRGLIESWRPDLIHANDLIDPDLLEEVASSGRGLLTLQDHRLFCPGRGKLTRDGLICTEPMGEQCLACIGDEDYGPRMLELTRRRLGSVRRMAGIITLSDYMRTELERVGVPPDRVEVIPPFVDGWETDPHRDLPGPGRYHLLIGRLAEHKGIRVALTAAALLQEPPGLVVVGEGSLSDQVDRAVQQAPGRIRREPWADRARLQELLDRAVSLWLPSTWAEPFGIAGLEAQSRGRPVVASRVGGIPEWVEDRREGLLVPPGDPALLAAAADELAADPELASRLGEQGRRRVLREHDPAALMERLFQLYRRRTSQPRATSSKPIPTEPAAGTAEPPG